MSVRDDGAPTFFLIRHGETDWNREGRLQGQRDIPLNPVGRDQAAGAGRVLRRLLDQRGLDPGRIRFVASPLGRARDTMEQVRRVIGLPPRGYALDDRLKEISFGAWEGRTWSELKREAPLLVKERKRRKWTFTPPHGESYADLTRRVRPWLDTIAAGDVVVAHGGVARVVLYARGHVTTAAAPDLDIVQGRILLVGAHDHVWA